MFYKCLLLSLIGLFGSCQMQNPKCIYSVHRGNVLYVGFENSMSVMIENEKCKSVFVTIDSGYIEKKDGCEYIVKVQKKGLSKFTVFKINKKDTTFIGSFFCRVKYLDDPIIKIAGVKEGVISKDIFLTAKRLDAVWEGFDSDIASIIKKYSVIIRDSNDNKIFSRTYFDGNINEELKTEIANLQTGSRVYFENIVVLSLQETIIKLVYFEIE